jgi:hypothetical protein
LFRLALVHLGLEADENIAVATDFAAVGLLLVNVEMSASLLHASADQLNTSFLISVSPHISPR